MSIARSKNKMNTQTKSKKSTIKWSSTRTEDSLLCMRSKGKAYVPSQHRQHRPSSLPMPPSLHSYPCAAGPDGSWHLRLCCYCCCCCCCYRCSPRPQPCPRSRLCCATLFNVARCYSIPCNAMLQGQLAPPVDWEKLQLYEAVELHEYSNTFRLTRSGLEDGRNHERKWVLIHWIGD